MKHSPIILASAVSAIFIFTACNNVEPKPSVDAKAQVQQQEADFRCRQDGVLAPKFTCNPHVDGMITALGVASMNTGNDRAFQRTEAMANARNALARELSIKASSMVKTFKSVTGSGKSATFDKATSEVSKQVASQTLKDSRQVGMSWSNPQTKELFILVGINTPEVKKELSHAIKTSFKNDEALYQQFLAKQANGELDKELESTQQ